MLCLFIFSYNVAVWKVRGTGIAMHTSTVLAARSGPAKRAVYPSVAVAASLRISFGTNSAVMTLGNPAS